MKSGMKYWFRAKTFGWGWGLPLTWQGWIVLIVYVLALCAGSVLFPPAYRMTAFQGWVWGWTGVLVWVCWKTGEPPGPWRWGKRKDESPDQTR